MRGWRVLRLALRLLINNGLVRLELVVIYQLVNLHLGQLGSHGYWSRLAYRARLQSWQRLRHLHWKKFTVRGVLRMSDNFVLNRQVAGPYADFLWLGAVNKFVSEIGQLAALLWLLLSRWLQPLLFDSVVHSCLGQSVSFRFIRYPLTPRKKLVVCYFVY